MVDEIDLALENPAGERDEGRVCLLPRLDGAEILLLHLCDQPYIGQIGGFVERLAGVHPHAFLHGLVDDDTISLGHDSDTPGGTAGPAQPGNFSSGMSSARSRWADAVPTAPPIRAAIRYSSSDATRSGA